MSRANQDEQDHTRQQEWEDEDALAYKRNASAFQKGISTYEVNEYYSQYCQQYEKDLRPGRYNGPRIAADTVARYYPRDRDQKKVIDIAAGTGFVAENLKGRGFQHIDALEPSANMIALAKKKDLYETFYENMLTGDPLNIETGGIICIVMRQCYLVDVEEYKDRLIPLLIAFENTGMWTRVSRHVVQDYFIDLPGVVFLYTVN